MAAHTLVPAKTGKTDSKVSGFKDIPKPDSKYTYAQVSRKPNELKPHPLLEALLRKGAVQDGERQNVQQLYQNQAEHFDYYAEPVITESGIVLSRWLDVLAALAPTGPTKINCQVVSGISDHELLEFVNFQTLDKYLTPKGKFLICREFEKYYVSKEEKFIDSKIAEITGFNEESVKRYLKIGELDETLFDREDFNLRRDYDAACRLTGDFHLDVIKDGQINAKWGQKKYEFKTERDWTYNPSAQTLSLVLTDDKKRILTITLDESKVSSKKSIDKPNA